MNKQKILKIILIFIGLLIIITSGIFIIQTLNDLDNLKFSQVKKIVQRYNNNKEIRNEKIVDILKATTDLENWNTYKNKELGFSIKYPLGYTPPNNKKAKEINPTEKNIRPDLIFWGSFIPKDFKTPTNDELPVLYGVYNLRIFTNNTEPEIFLNSSMHGQYNSIIDKQKNQNDILFYKVDTSGLTSTFAFITFENNKAYEISFDTLSLDDKDYFFYQENIEKIIDSFQIIK